MKPQTPAQKRADLIAWKNLGKARDDRERKAAAYFSQVRVGSEWVPVAAAEGAGE
jgi:hypothetical protein